MKEQTHLLLAGAAIIVLATLGVLLVLQPDDPKVALGDTAAAALFASIIVLAKVRRDHWLQ
ncbi:hypothetical protein [Methylobacterium durans]|uniref:Uncharacterized protein n=1 Tax=Methylobacterium durans TaxID=2202825 RepID=A0A2U8W1N3_9HYPH|nr:hypothetical protein [Methylobacterium durans]AWN39975.1 hypothetical protein DK389_04725 [Methylobacterium durans]